MTGSRRELTSCMGNCDGILVRSGPCTMIFLALGTLADIMMLGWKWTAAKTVCLSPGPFHLSELVQAFKWFQSNCSNYFTLNVFKLCETLFYDFQYEKLDTFKSFSQMVPMLLLFVNKRTVNIVVFRWYFFICNLSRL